MSYSSIISFLFLYIWSVIVSFLWLYRDRNAWEYVEKSKFDWVGMIFISILPVLNVLIPLTIVVVVMPRGKE